MKGVCGIYHAFNVSLCIASTYTPLLCVSACVHTVRSRGHDILAARRWNWLSVIGRCSRLSVVVRLQKGDAPSVRRVVGPWS